MRYDDIHLAGTGSWHPKTVPVDDAIADGRYTREYQRETGQRRVAVADDPADSTPAMALRAGRAALAHARIPSDRFELLLHGVATHNGLPGWNAAAHLQHELLDGHGTASEVHQLSNSGLGALELAAARLSLTEPGTAALVTTSDRFDENTWNRWQSAPPVFVFGDGAAALVLTRGGGFARLITSVSLADTGLEGMQRGALPFTTDPRQGYPINFFDRIMEFSDTLHGGLDEAKQRMADLMHRTGTRALAEAGITTRDLRHVVTPALGREALYEQCLDPLGIELDRSTWHIARDLGHAGCTDQLTALDHLARGAALDTGDRILLTSVGGGYNCTAAVVEITAPPTPPAEVAEAAHAPGKEDTCRP